VAGNDDPPEVHERQQRQRAGDAVGGAQVGVTIGEQRGWGRRGDVGCPPARRRPSHRVLGGQRFSEPDQVGQDPAELIAVGRTGRETDAEAGQPADQVELRTFRSPSRVDPRMGRREPALHQPLHGRVQLPGRT